MSSKIKYKVFTVADLPFAMACQKLSFCQMFDAGMGGDGLQEFYHSAMEQKMPANFICIIGTDTGFEPVSVCVVEWSKKESSANYLHTFVNDTRRGEGNGREIVREMMIQAKRLSIRLSDTSFNDQSKDFYKKVMA
jgi:predicted GNAT family acetyltransferase